MVNSDCFLIGEPDVHFSPTQDSEFKATEEGSHPGLSVPLVRLVPLLLTENKGSVLDSAGLSPSLR